MNPARDTLYQVHQFQAARRGQPPLPHDLFRARLATTFETDLTGLLTPPPTPTVRVEVRRRPKFELGRMCITAAASRAVPPEEVAKALARHVVGDWGDLDAHDWAANEQALRDGGRLLSVYQTAEGCRFYVITEPSRELTTLLLPEDY